MRIVIDTNTVISGLGRRTGSNPSQILKLWEQGDIKLLTSPDTLAELNRVVTYPRVKKYLKISDNELERFLILYATTSTIVREPEPLHFVTSDIDDNIFVDLAVAGQARYLVTGDKKHLLPLVWYQDIAIITPATFIGRYHQEQ